MEVIQKYFPGLDEIQLRRYSHMVELYNYWNERINVISRKDIDNLYLHHILHSMSLAKVMPLKTNEYVLDVGTGGGFPGIPLAILYPETNFHLVDSIGKKIKVVEAITKELGLLNVTYQQIRAEQINRKFDFIVSRAVTTLPEFVKWVAGKINKKSKYKIRNGIFFLKGGDLTDELAPFRKIATEFEISDFFTEEYFRTKKIVYLPLV